MNFTLCLSVILVVIFLGAEEGGEEYLKGKINEFETLVCKGKGGFGWHTLYQFPKTTQR
jgi:hypothetical protein